VNFGVLTPEDGEITDPTFLEGAPMPIKDPVSQ